MQIFREALEVYRDTTLDLENVVVIATTIIEKNQFDAWKDVLPFYKNINREGSQLWKAA